MIIVIIIGGGDTGENPTCPALVAFFRYIRWGKIEDIFAEVSHVSPEFSPLGIVRSLLHSLPGSYPHPYFQRFSMNCSYFLLTSS